MERKKTKKKGRKKFRISQARTCCAGEVRHINRVKGKLIKGQIIDITAPFVDMVRVVFVCNEKNEDLDVKDLSTVIIDLIEIKEKIIENDFFTGSDRPPIIGCKCDSPKKLIRDIDLHMENSFMIFNGITIGDNVIIEFESQYFCTLYKNVCEPVGEIANIRKLSVSYVYSLNDIFPQEINKRDSISYVAIRLVTITNFGSKDVTNSFSDFYFLRQEVAMTSLEEDAGQAKHVFCKDVYEDSLDFATKHSNIIVVADKTGLWARILSRRAKSLGVLVLPIMSIKEHAVYDTIYDVSMRLLSTPIYKPTQSEFGAFLEVEKRDYSFSMISVMEKIVAHTLLFEKVIFIARVTTSNLYEAFLLRYENLVMNAIFASGYATHSGWICSKWSAEDLKMSKLLRSNTNNVFRFSKPGVYNNVVSIDYTSCYPLIMINHNICVSTVHVNPSSDVIAEEKLDWIYSFKSENGEIKVYTVDKTKRRGLLPRFLEKLYAIKKSSDYKAVKAIKLVMNCVYGVMGAVGQFESVTLAFLVCNIQRDRMISIKTILDKSSALTCIYAHTDGLLISMGEYEDVELLLSEKSSDSKDALEVTKTHILKACETEKELLEKLFMTQEIHIERFHVRVLIKNSNAYFGLMESGELFSKGIVSRGSELVSSVTKEIYKKFLSFKSVTGIRMTANVSDFKKIRNSQFLVTETVRDCNVTDWKSKNKNKKKRDSVYAVVGGASKSIPLRQFQKKDCEVEYQRYFGFFKSEIDAINSICDVGKLKTAKKKSLLLKLSDMIENVSSTSRGNLSECIKCVKRMGVCVKTNDNSPDLFCSNDRCHYWVDGLDW